MIGRWAVGLGIVAHALSGHPYVVAWQTNLSLWTWAYHQAPANVRVTLNYGRYCLAAGQDADALHAFATVASLR